ncbi:cell wall elongation regulator TseB-like domain-containing protein [Lentibacillus juripiscarius]|uniref:DUF5590 domain-containing protein n=1 Tax=Lentibacillus juripiscarius TaxID=257446 RepID=A0ABW5V4P2_9BACI
MKPRFSRFTIPAWLKWLTGIICFVVISCLITGIYLYYSTQQERTAEFDQVEQDAIKETEMSTVNRIERFHGKDAYYVIYGETDNNQSAIMFYPFAENDTETVLVERSETISEETVKADWQSNCSDCTLFTITPALITNDKLPAWEITYENDAGRYIMEYVSLNDGELIEKIGFKRMFN